MTMGTWTFFKMYIFSIEKSGLSIVIDSLPEWVNMRLPKILPLFWLLPNREGTAARGIQRQAENWQIRGLGETGIGWSKDTYLFKRMVIGMFSPLKSGWFLGETIGGGGVLIKNRIQGFVIFSLKKQWCWFWKIHQEHGGWSKCSEQTKF